MLFIYKMLFEWLIYYIIVEKEKFKSFKWILKIRKWENYANKKSYNWRPTNNYGNF